ncbi:MAG: Rossmann-like and DUF2520 domain-containing protein [Candidatus Saccharicenans sp.]|uniref:Rossmann-like and DUF2520 domain-containing protein n=1 Tax=Candidatus Saccharicenans sp. TaxID=2819258 RepID=UPI00404B392E
MKTLSIIGAGRVGTALAAGLARKGLRLKYLADSKPDQARRARKMIGQGLATTDNKLAARSAEIIFICVPDDLIPVVVKELLELNWQGKYVFHTSGALTSDLLQPLSARGARVASFHPAQTFAGDWPEPGIFQGIWIGLEGQTEAVKLGKKLAARLGAQTLLLSAREKPLYHLALSISSNFLIVLLNEVKELLQASGLEEETILEILTPLLNKTLQNVKKLGIEPSLTGPVVRGDLETVKKHLSLTSGRPELDRTYRALALEALKIAERRGLSPEKIRALRHLLEQK